MGGCQRSFGFIAADFERTDPVLAGVLALHVAASLGNAVSGDRLSLERITCSRPIVQLALLEVQIQLSPIARLGQLTCRQSKLHCVDTYHVLLGGGRIGPSQFKGQLVVAGGELLRTEIQQSCGDDLGLLYRSTGMPSFLSSNQICTMP